MIANTAPHKQRCRASPAPSSDTRSFDRKKAARAVATSASSLFGALKGCASGYGILFMLSNTLASNILFDIVCTGMRHLSQVVARIAAYGRV
jgi:hypothetical protein